MRNRHCPSRLLFDNERTGNGELVSRTRRDGLAMLTLVLLNRGQFQRKRPILGDDTNNAILSEIVTAADGTVLTQNNFTRDATGNPLTASNAAGAYTYSYDTNEKVQSATDPQRHPTELWPGWGGQRDQRVRQPGWHHHLGVQRPEPGGDADLPGSGWHGGASRFDLRQQRQRADADALQRRGGNAVAGEVQLYLQQCKPGDAVGANGRQRQRHRELRIHLQLVWERGHRDAERGDDDLHARRRRGR